MLLISAHILPKFRLLWLFKKLGKWLEIYPEDNMSYTSNEQATVLQNVMNEYWDQYRK